MSMAISNCSAEKVPASRWVLACPSRVMPPEGVARYNSVHNETSVFGNNMPEV
jgi:hypothetical protein